MGKRTRSEGTKPLSTTKKQKYVGSMPLVDPYTGEVIPMQLVQVEERDFSFHKVWLENLILAIDGISNQRLRLAFWILDHLDSENKLVMTQRAIAKESGMSLDTVTKTMKALQDGDPAFLQKINSGAYRVNPDILWKGSHNKRLGVIFDYAETQRKTAEATGKTAKIPVSHIGLDQMAYEIEQKAKYIERLKATIPELEAQGIDTSGNLADIAEAEAELAAAKETLAAYKAKNAANGPQTPVEAPEAAGDTEEPLPGQTAFTGFTEAIAATETPKDSRRKIG